MKSKTQRTVAAIIKEICKERGIECQTFSQDWVFLLHDPQTDHYAHIFGYMFGLNPASVSSICCDKGAASNVMTALGIPNVEHVFFMSGANQEYNGPRGNWLKLIDMLKCHGTLVCKDNDGTGGRNVFKVSTQGELEYAAQRIFQNSRMAVSPYISIRAEYRTIVLDGEIKLMYSKERPHLTGDGHSTLGELILKYMQTSSNEKLSLLQDIKADLSKVLQDGETFQLNWKHNLGQGAHAERVTSLDVIRPISRIVDDVVRKMGVRFASIDIVVDENGDYKVLEINSGVMMEHFAEQSAEDYATAKSIYAEAIMKMLE